MSLVSGAFIGVMIATAILYYLSPKKFKPYLLLIISVLVYSSLGVKSLVYIVISTITTYVAGLLFEKNKYKKLILIVTLVINLGILVVIKSELVKNIIVPLGVSYYTFQVVSYLIDVYRNKYKPERNIAKYFLYTMYFPYLFIGPINRYDDISKTLFETDKKFNPQSAYNGILRIGWGFFKKLIISNRINVLISAITQNPTEYNGAFAFFAMLLYSIQLYADFSGGIDIVLGFSKVLQINLKENFNTPYISQNIQEFWRRWHISLSSWFRDYVYIPLGGNRCSKLRNYFNTIVVFLLSGLWHGVNYILWGLFHGIFLIIGKFIKVKNKYVNITVTFLVVSFLWSFFIWPTAIQSLQMIGSVFTTFNYQELFANLLNLGLNLANYIVLIIAVILLIIYDLKREKINSKIKNLSTERKLIIFAVLVWIVLIFGMYGIGFNASDFIYNKF